MKWKVLSQEMFNKFEYMLNDYCDDNDVEIKYSPKNLTDRFNFYGKFQYVIMDVEIMVMMPKGTFPGFEYYLGMEYDRDLITSRFENERQIILFYEASDRLLKIVEFEKDYDED